HMPGMDGFETARQIRLHPENKDIPIVALSAEVFNHQQEKAYDTEISDYLLKPIQVNELLVVLAKYLRQDQSGPVLEPLSKTPLPDEVKTRLLEEFKVLSAIPPFYVKRITIQIQKMTELCKDKGGRLYNSPYLTILKKIQDTSGSGNSERIPELINKVLNG
ncbi:MAG: response regulator, partial [Bacteroidetes bacterium]|nr:response regulator [Bacteroidota bacterium]